MTPKTATIANAARDECVAELVDLFQANSSAAFLVRTYVQEALGKVLVNTDDEGKQWRARIEELIKDCADHERHRTLNLSRLLHLKAALETVKSDTALHAGCGATYEAVCEALKTP